VLNLLFLSKDGFGDPIFQWINNQWVQVGIGSYCGMSDKLGIFTSLAAYSNWIGSVLNSTIGPSSNIYQCDKKAPCGCGQTDVKLTVSGITGSETAIKDSWPMIVSFQINGLHICAGTILSDSFILTSVECASSFYYYGPNMTIVAGINTLSETVTIRRKIRGIYISSNYSSSLFDLPAIAIVHLDQPLPIDNASSVLGKICLPDGSESLTNDDLKSNLPLAIIGWDDVRSESRVSDALQQISARMPGNEHKLCRNSLINDTYEFCAGVSSHTKINTIKYLCSGKDS
jgi:secreted trypsin-like serine protease